MRKFIVYFFMLLPAYAIAAQPLDKVVAVVNDGVITSSELDSQVNILRRQLMSRHMVMPSDAALRKQVLQHLIDVDLQLQIAKNNDITVDSTELDASIAKIAADNHLTMTALREELARQGLDWQTYRENVRKEIVISRIQQRAVTKDVVISTQQVDDYLKTAIHDAKSQQLYHLQNIVIPLQEEPTTAQVTKAQAKIRSLLNKIKHGADFSGLAIAESSGEFALEGGDLGERHLAELPEIFATKVVDMHVGEVLGPIRTGNGFQLIKLIAINANNAHHNVTKTHVRHILLKQDSRTTLDVAKKQIDNLYQQLQSGKDFALMAKMYSLDAASATKGGDLGWVTSDELVPAFSEAMNALPVKTISKPVQSPFGWHLIEVLERKEVDDSQAFQRQQVKNLLQQRKFNEAVQNWQQHMRADSYVKILDKDLA